MPAFKPILNDDDLDRGRRRTTKCLFSMKHPKGVSSHRRHTSWQALKSQWQPSIEEEEGNGVAECICGQRIEYRAETSALAIVTTHMESYPPYLQVSGTRSILVKGTTSRLVMQLIEGRVPLPKVTQELAKRQPKEIYSTSEVQSIKQTCSTYGLHGQSPCATASWESEPIECWWLKEDSYCETLRREQPPGEEICGYSCNNGWWKDRQHRGNRDWSTWGYRSIGPAAWRRKQYRPYDLYGSVALRTDGAD